jgi:enamine deaminase RidA (YjgF/YER057c/UK114 family)
VSQTIGTAQKEPLGPVVVNGTTMPYSKGVVAGDFVFLTGTVGAVDGEGNPVEGIEEQTRLALDSAAEALHEAGSTMDRAVRINQYLADVSLRERYVRAREAWIAEHAPSLTGGRGYASVLLIQELASAHYLVEIEVTALR